MEVVATVVPADQYFGLTQHTQVVEVVPATGEEAEETSVDLVVAALAEGELEEAIKKHKIISDNIRL